MSKYRIIRTSRPKFHGDGSEGRLSLEGLVKDIAGGRLTRAINIKHDDNGPGGIKQLTRAELFRACFKNGFILLPGA